MPVTTEKTEHPLSPTLPEGEGSMWDSKGSVTFSFVPDKVICNVSFKTGTDAFWKS